MLPKSSWIAYILEEKDLVWLERENKSKEKFQTCEMHISMFNMGR